MKRLLLFIFLLPTFVFSQKVLRDSVLIKSDIFTIMYSEKLEQPLWAKYEVKCPNGTAKRTGMTFYKCDSVHTSDAADYFDNVYDEGHLAPAADFSCSTDMMRKTFTFLNCSLQNQYLNRGTWRFLEVHERELAKHKKIQVTIRLTFGSEKLKTGATVPTGFYKEITGEGIHECYYFKNEKPESSDYTKYKCKN